MTEQTRLATEANKEIAELMAAHLRQHGIKATKVEPVERLCELTIDGAGVLRVPRETIRLLTNSDALPATLFGLPVVERVEEPASVPQGDGADA